VVTFFLFATLELAKHILSRGGSVSVSDTEIEQRFLPRLKQRRDDKVGLLETLPYSVAIDHSPARRLDDWLRRHVGVARLAGKFGEEIAELVVAVSLPPADLARHAVSRGEGGEAARASRRKIRGLEAVSKCQAVPEFEAAEAEAALRNGGNLKPSRVRRWVARLMWGVIRSPVREFAEFTRSRRAWRAAIMRLR
jgi:hypothetical protein